METDDDLCYVSDTSGDDWASPPTPASSKRAAARAATRAARRQPRSPDSPTRATFTLHRPAPQRAVNVPRLRAGLALQASGGH